MRFLIVTHTPHFVARGKVYAYGPYVREMNLWNAHVDEVIVVAPISNKSTTKIHESYTTTSLKVEKIPSMGFVSLRMALRTIVCLPVIFWTLFNEMHKADHIHLRCPGTIGLVGCILQILFPKKTKTVKYAGNWDPSAKQPLSYKLQKWILSNTFLTKNMKVLVYGEWENQSKNIVPFFTASYNTSEIIAAPPKDFTAPFSFLFVGSLVAGKRPLYAIQLVEKLSKNGIFARLTLYGDGVLAPSLQQYVDDNNLNGIVDFKGNQTAAVVKAAYQESHFLLLPSKSEGWPKVVAEAMFWGAIPLSTGVSCVPWMLDRGKRGRLLTLQIEKDKRALIDLLIDKKELNAMQDLARQWSRKYTLDSFEAAIIKLLQ